MMKLRELSKMNERGGAGIKAVVALLILVTLFYAGMKIIPVYYDHWNFEDKVKNAVQFAFQNCSGDTKKCLEKTITDLLNEMGATYDKKNVKVKVEVKKINVEVWYSRTIEFPFFPNPKNFYVKVENVPFES